VNRLWPRPVGNGTVVTIGAWLLVAAWAILAANSLGLFWRRHTSMITFRPASARVLSAPYKVSRNPMYVLLALLTVAFALFF
jgi:protein-S-isoprenylcysteine O-methyltransferase Ste14